MVSTVADEETAFIKFGREEESAKGGRGKESAEGVEGSYYIIVNKEKAPRDGRFTKNIVIQ